MNRNVVIYAGNFCVPDGNAAGKRVFANAYALKKYGYEVICFGFHFGQKGKESRIIDGIESVSLKYVDGFSRVFNSYFLKEFKDMLEKHGGYQKVCAVILYSAMGTMRFNEKIISYCKERNIKTVFDFTDYYDNPDKNNLLKYFVKKADNYVLKERVLKKADGVIAISSFGRLFCQNRKSIIVPPLSLQNTSREPEQLPNRISFSFASVITDINRPLNEWKDRIDVIIRAFYLLMMGGCNNFQIHFVGFDSEHFLRMLEPKLRNEYCQIIEELGDHLHFHGKMNNSLAQMIVLNSHYTILIRQRMISTNVGFPSKVSEAISLGVPIVSNISSDIAYYIREGKNGFLIDDPDNIENIVKKLKEIISIPREKYKRMANALKDNNPFYFELYQNRLGDFIGSL